MLDTEDPQASIEFGVSTTADSEHLIRRSEHSRKMTDKAEEALMSEISSRINKLNKTSKLIDDEIGLFANTQDPNQLEQIKQTVASLHLDYDGRCAETLQFLYRQRSEICEEEAVRLVSCKSAVDLKVTALLTKIEVMLESVSQVQGTASLHTSLPSRSKTSRSSMSSILKQKVKIEAARVKMEFAKREAEYKRECAVVEEQTAKINAELDRRKSEIETQQDLLKSEMDLAIAEAELQAVTCQDEDTVSKVTSRLERRTRDERTRLYVPKLLYQCC